MYFLRCWESNSEPCTWSQVIATALYSHLLVFQDNLTRTAQAVLSTKSSCLCLPSARITAMCCHAASHRALQPCPLWQSALSNPFQLSEGMHSNPLFHLSPQHSKFSAYLWTLRHLVGKKRMEGCRNEEENIPALGLQNENIPLAAQGLPSVKLNPRWLDLKDELYRNDRNQPLLESTWGRFGQSKEVRLWNDGEHKVKAGSLLRKQISVFRWLDFDHSVPDLGRSSHLTLMVPR